MDMREIQRLHAQFAPDSMVIDLPRQIAALPALPAPSDFYANPTPTARARWLKAGPIARRSVIVVALAGVIGMAGMGAASVYTTWRSAHRTVAAAAAQKAGQATPPTAPGTSTSAYQEVNATPARPIQNAPTLSAHDFANPASVGLTADQFRDSLKTPSRGATTNAPAMNADAERAAASPIHRTAEARQQPVSQPQSLPETVTNSATRRTADVPAHAVAPKTEPAPAAQPQAAPAGSVNTATAGDADKPAHPVHRHVSRPRVETPVEPAASPKPATAPHSGAAEVQMF